MYEALVSRDLYLVAGCAAAGSIFLAARHPARRTSRWRLSIPASRSGRDRRRGATTMARRARARARGAPRRLRACRSMAHEQRPVGAVRRGRLRAADAAAHHDAAGSGGGEPPAVALRLSRCASRTGSSTATSRIAAVRCRFGSSATARCCLSTPRTRIPLVSARRRRTRARPVRAPRRRAPACRSAWRSAPPSARMLLGALVGGLAGFFGGVLDDGLMRVADVIMALPAVYVVLALRASMPLVLTTTAGLLDDDRGARARSDGRFPARGVRAVVAAERAREYAEAARAMGASRTRILLRHLLPAARGFLIVQATLLVPAFVLAEATLSLCRAGVRRADSQLGRDVTRRRPRPGPRRSSLAAGPCRRSSCSRRLP